MRVLILLAMAVCAVVAAIVYLPALAVRAVAGVLVAAERWACGRIMWAMERLRQ